MPKTHPDLGDPELFIMQQAAINAKLKEQERISTSRPRDYYSDTDERMRSDVDFRAAVHCLMAMAEQSGFTPGELKQIAFRAALELEMRRSPSPLHPTGDEPREPKEEA